MFPTMAVNKTKQKEKEKKNLNGVSNNGCKQDEESKKINKK